VDGAAVERIITETRLRLPESKILVEERSVSEPTRRSQVLMDRRLHIQEALGSLGQLYRILRTEQRAPTEAQLRTALEKIQQASEDLLATLYAQPQDEPHPIRSNIDLFVKLVSQDGINSIAPALTAPLIEEASRDLDLERDPSFEVGIGLGSGQSRLEEAIQGVSRLHRWSAKILQSGPPPEKWSALNYVF